jgi:membrane protease YdiL (CAAX protease family)
MPSWLPPRPRYAKEKALFTYPLLAAFLLLFVLRVLDRYMGLPLNAATRSLLLPVLVFFLPALVFIRARGEGYTRALRLRRPFAMQIPLLAFALVAIFSGCSLLSILFGGIESLGNSQMIYEEFTTKSLFALIAAVPFLAVIPAVLEELLFRGVLCVELERRGALRAVLISALFFALIHFDLANLLVYFYAGILLALTLYATDSLPATMLLHACYNLLSLFAQRFLAAFYAFTGSVELFLFFFILIFLLSLILFARECARLYRMRDEANVRPPRRAVPRNVQIYTLIDALCEWPVVVCILLSIVGFIVL